jgi:predicted RNA-binding protein with PIN domain
VNAPERWVLIDGYSLVHRDETTARVHRGGRLFEARRRLVRRLERIAPQLGRRVTVVFDGRDTGGPETDAPSGPVEVVFSPAAASADAWIERAAHECAGSQAMLVVTSDRLEREAASASGADTMGCGDFLDLCARIEAGLSGAARRATAPAPRRTLGDLFPPRA